MTRDFSGFLALDFLSLTIGIVVYFVGVIITQRVKFLRDFSIPEPVSGGFIAGAAISLIYVVFNLEIDFDLTTRDRLLVIFFAAVGINTRLADLVAGGRTMIVLCVVSALFVLIQNIVGTAGALAFGMPSAAGLEVAPTGRIAVYCGNACRQAAFIRNTRTALSADDRQRLLIWSVLQEAGLIEADRPLPTRKQGQRVTATPTGAGHQATTAEPDVR